MNTQEVAPHNAGLKGLDRLEHSSQLVNHLDLVNYNPKWLIPSFIPKNTLISFYAMPGSGKSITAIFLAVYLLRNKIVDRVCYIDADNGFATIKNRGIEQILKDYPTFFYLNTSKNTKNLDINTKNIIYEIADNMSEKYANSLLIIDSIRNFIDGNMSHDNEVMPTLNALQIVRENSAGAWFLNHQNKQSFIDENNKSFKGATSFFDSVDELFFVQKHERKDNQLIVTLENMKQRHDTKPQALIINTATQELIFDDYFIYAMNDKQSHALEYAKEIIVKNQNGINLKNLTNEIKRMAKIDEAQVCGINALKKLLMQFDGKFYQTDIDTSSYKQLIFKPLKN